MNKEFIILSDGDVAVTSETGQISIRTYNNSTKEILLLENKIEIADDKLDELNNALHNQKNCVLLSKWMIILQPIILLLLIIGMFVYGILSIPENFDIFTIFSGINGGLMVLGAHVIYYSIVKSICRKKINKIEKEITIVQKLKEKYEKELSSFNKKQLIIETPSIFANEPISLVDYTNSMKTQIDEEIDRTYTENFNYQPKKLMLRKKK